VERARARLADASPNASRARAGTSRCRGPRGRARRRRRSGAAALGRSLDQRRPTAIRVVVHAAGVQHPRALDELGEPELREDLRAKLAGAVALEHVFGEQLECLLLFSSAATCCPRRCWADTRPPTRSSMDWRGAVAPPAGPCARSLGGCSATGHGSSAHGRAWPTRRVRTAGSRGRVRDVGSHPRGRARADRRARDRLAACCKRIRSSPRRPTSS